MHARASLVIYVYSSLLLLLLLFQVRHNESDGCAWVQWGRHAVFKIKAIIKKNENDNKKWKWAQNLSDSFAMSFYVSDSCQMAEVTFDLNKSG